MRLPRVRFTVRQLMYAVAIASVALASDRWSRQSAEYRSQAEHHQLMLSILRGVRETGGYPYCSLGMSGIPLRYNSETAPLHVQCVSYHTQMTRKYQRAAFFPWLGVDPDPPPPYPIHSYFE
jgi:hypothetical protein